METSEMTAEHVEEWLREEFWVGLSNGQVLDLLGLWLG
jgi:hypothetical protein